MPFTGKKNLEKGVIMKEETKKEKLIYGETEVERLDTIELKSPIHLKYVKIRNNLIEEEGCTYGIEIIKEEMKDNKIEEEREEIGALYRSEEQADEVLEILKRNKVTPIELKDVISDINFRYE